MTATTNHVFCTTTAPSTKARVVTGPVRRSTTAPCGEEFTTAQDATDHKFTCGACAGAEEAA